MKFDDLKSIGHNVADSFASGVGFMIGVYITDVFGEAANSPEGHITVDFLKGEAISGSPSTSLARAMQLYGEALSDLCAKHGAKTTDFKTLTARFGTDRVRGSHFTVTVEDQNGKKSSDRYFGVPGRRPRGHS